jgi:hypothetical protein
MPEKLPLGDDLSSRWTLSKSTCPACRRYILGLTEEHERIQTPGGIRYQKNRSWLCYPKAVSRTPLSSDVPQAFATDYREACITLADSAKASAALSRRCLQHVLREIGKVKPGNLADEIQQVMDSGKLPTHLAESLDAIRNIGNFAAHPIKSKASGEVLDVEPGEAEWNLDVLEGLFDFYFIQPAITKKRREDLNQKLRAAGKPELK